MRKIISLVLALICALSSVGCNQQGDLQQGDHNMQYFFTAKVIEVHEEYLLLEVFDTGNSNLYDGTKVEVSTGLNSADGCPEFVVNDCVRVLMSQNADNNSSVRLQALSIYKTDENGNLKSD